MFPLALVFFSVLMALSGVMVLQTSLMAKTNHFYVVKSYLSNEADNAVERMRRGFAAQIAEHVEIASIQAPQMPDVEVELCNTDERRCRATVKQSFEFIDHGAFETPVPSDTPVPCNSPTTYGENITGQCNLSMGGGLDEARRMLRVHIVMNDLDGGSIGATDRDVRIRIFRLSPYAQVVGVRSLTSSSNIKSVGDIAGFDSKGGIKQDTLLRSYSPCVDLPESAPTPRSDHQYYWSEWGGGAWAAAAVHTPYMSPYKR